VAQTRRAQEPNSVALHADDFFRLVRKAATMPGGEDLSKSQVPNRQQLYAQQPQAEQHGF